MPLLSERKFVILPQFLAANGVLDLIYVQFSGLHYFWGVRTGSPLILSGGTFNKSGLPALVSLLSVGDGEDGGVAAAFAAVDGEVVHEVVGSGAGAQAELGTAVQIHRT